jgi:uncharacterized oligopeptide transporter (OPT) family protein
MLNPMLTGLQHRAKVIRRIAFLSILWGVIVLVAGFTHVAACGYIMLVVLWILLMVAAIRVRKSLRSPLITQDAMAWIAFYPDTSIPMNYSEALHSLETLE